MEERLEVAHRAGDVRRLLDLERELARGDAVRAGADDEQVAGLGDRAPDRSGSLASCRAVPPAPPRCPRRRAPAGRSGVDGPAAPAARRRRQPPRSATRTPPCGTTPVHLDRREHDVCAPAGAGAPGARGDQRRPSAPDRAASSAAIVAAVPPSWLMPMTSPRVGRRPGTARRPGRASGPRPGSPAARHASRSTSATAWAACSDVPQPVTSTGSRATAAARTASASARRRAVAGQPRRRPRDERGLRGDHLGHRPRRARADRRRRQGVPGIRRARERRLGVEASRGVHARMLGPAAAEVRRVPSPAGRREPPDPPQRRAVAEPGPPDERGTGTGP